MLSSAAAGPVRLWPGLADLRPGNSDQPPIDELKFRLIAVQVLEAARCLADGSVGSPADADVAAVFGAGFAPWTGGPISYVDTAGPAAFAARCSHLAGRLGPRFDPSVVLRFGPERSGGGYYHQPRAA